MMMKGMQKQMRTVMTKLGVAVGAGLRLLKWAKMARLVFLHGCQARKIDTLTRHTLHVAGLF